MSAAREATKTGRWTEEELQFLIENAGRIPEGKICRGLNRTPEDVEDVAARVRATGYPISLQVETCPMCGRRAPLMYSTGICKPCQYSRAYARTNREISEVLPLLKKEDRATYEDTEAETGRSRVIDPMPHAPALAEDATEAERASAEDAYCVAMAEWRAKGICRKVKNAQKRKERMIRKARANGADVAVSPKWQNRALATA